MLPEAVPCGVLRRLEVTPILEVALASLFFDTWSSVNGDFVVLSNAFMSISIRIEQQLPLEYFTI